MRSRSNRPSAPNPFTRKLPKVTRTVSRRVFSQYVATASRHADEEANEAFDAGFEAGQTAMHMALTGGAK